ncbi:MAG: autotransporter-associated beta strand repeat-containing protein [Moraxellaceae bacterium]|nr:autotransporter-associated beta strand repeat-containing protein [Moraxellaceae bacterium]
MAGSLVKDGAGLLSLTGANNSYAGGTQVNAGKK